MEDRPDRAVADRHRFLQAADVPVDLPQQAGNERHLLADQPHQVRPSGRSDRRGRTARAAGPCPHPAPVAGRKHLAARQHLLRQAPDVPPRFHGMVRGAATAALPPRKARRPVRADLRGQVARGDAVGDPGPRRADGAAHPRRAEGHGPVRASGALRPRDDPAVGKDRTAAPDRRACGSPISAPGAGIPSCGRTGACRR